MNLSKHKTKQILLTFSKSPLSKDSRNPSLAQIFTLFQVHVPFKKTAEQVKWLPPRQLLSTLAALEAGSLEVLTARSSPFLKLHEYSNLIPTYALKDKSPFYKWWGISFLLKEKWVKHFIYLTISVLLHIVLVQLLSHVWLSATSWTLARHLPCPPLPPRICSNACTLSW